MRHKIGVLFLFVVLCCFISLPAQAQSPKGIQVQPIRSYPTLDPGTTLTASLKLTNTTSEPQPITMKVENFSVHNSDYDYTFRDSEETKWITFKESSLILQPNQTKTIDYTIAVPGNANPGGHYFSLLTTIEPKDTDQGVTEIRRVASLVYLEVSGEIIKDASLTSFVAPWFSLDRNIPSEAYVANKGNSHVRARVLIQGQSLWDKVTLQPQRQYSVLEGTILPTTLRKLSGQITLPNRPGLFRINAEYSAPQGGGTTSIQRTIIYMPVWFMCVLAGLVVAIVGLITRLLVSRKHSLKRSKKAP